MAMHPDEIGNMIREALPDSTVHIKDLAGDGDHYSAIVISNSFKGLTRIQQHKLVYDALKGNMGGKLHALQLTTKIQD